MLVVKQESINLIRQHIIDCEGKATKSEVVKYMQNEVPHEFRLSRDTTAKVIDNMDNIIVSKGERRGQAHKLLIEDKGDFNQISAELSEIEYIVDSMSESMKIIKSICDFDPSSVRETPDRWILRDLDNNFVEPYVLAIDEMLEILMALTSKRIQSQKDSWSIYRRIIEVMIKLNLQHSHFGSKGVDGLLFDYNFMMDMNLEQLTKIRKDDREYAERNGIPIDKLRRNLRSRLKKFKVRFLANHSDKRNNNAKR